MTEPLTQRTISYTRRKSQVTILLTGICDIFEVASLKAEFVKANNDPAAQKIVIDCKNLTRIDTSIAQLLACFDSSISSSDKELVMTNVTEQVEKYLSFAGISCA